MRILLTLTLAATATAQPDFTLLTPTTSPSPRAGATGVTDGALLYSFGGKPGPGVERNDMWVFTGTDWIDITPTSGTSPAGRDWYAAAYDTTRGVYVLFGGRSSSLGTLGDTWEFDGTAWTQRTPATSPTPRRWAAMAYDPVAGACILFGGHDGAATYNNETWSWDGTNWTQLAPATSPSARGRGKLSYDSSDGTMIYHGGRATSSIPFSDTWQWNGSNWSQIVTANAPSSSGVAGRFAYGFTYDALRDRHVLFGGTRNGPTLGDCWEFDGVDWTQRAISSPGSRTGPTFAYVPGFQKTFLFGGFQGPQLDDTAEYQTADIASASSYGAGCPGPGGALSLTEGNRPWIDSTWTASCTTLGPTSIGLFVYGFSPIALPLNTIFSFAGAGCDLLTTADAIDAAFPFAGLVSTSLPLPNDPSLAGQQLNLQVVEIEFGLQGEWVGMFGSNALTITVGIR